MPQVLIVLGSESDVEVLEKSEAIETLDYLGIDKEISIMSAHRNPDAVKDYVAKKTGLIKNSIPIFIAAAGMAAHLPGVIASHGRLCPVIGVALPSGEFPNAMDAMLSISRMPKGVPVAFAGIGKAGFLNAAILACQMLALRDVEVVCRLQNYLSRLDKPPKIDVGVENGRAILQNKIAK